jgi:hypothetical protein
LDCTDGLRSGPFRNRMLGNGALWATIVLMKP